MTRRESLLAQLDRTRREIDEWPAQWQMWARGYVHRQKGGPFAGDRGEYDACKGRS